MTFEDVFASKIKIIKTLRRAGEPLIAQHIAKRSRLNPQVVSYQLEQMVDWGIITKLNVEDKMLYQLQKSYCDEKLLELLSNTLIPFMNRICNQMDFSQIKISSTEAVMRNLFMFLRMFESELGKLPVNNDLSNSGCEPLK